MEQLREYLTNGTLSLPFKRLIVTITFHNLHFFFLVLRFNTPFHAFYVIMLMADRHSENLKCIGNRPRRRSNLRHSRKRCHQFIKRGPTSRALYKVWNQSIFTISRGAWYHLLPIPYPRNELRDERGTF